MVDQCLLVRVLAMAAFKVAILPWLIGLQLISIAQHEAVSTVNKDAVDKTRRKKRHLANNKLKISPALP